MSRNKHRMMQATSEEMDLCKNFDESYDDDEYDPDLYIPKKQHMGRKLRKPNVPYQCTITDEMLFEGLDYKHRIGTLKPHFTRGDVEFCNVSHAGGYIWKEALMKNQLGVDHMAAGERVLVTPGFPDVLGDPHTVGHVESDAKAGLVDHVIDTKDASYLRPAFSPFECLFRSLISSPIVIKSNPFELDPKVPNPYPSLDDLDIIADHTTLLLIAKFLRDPVNQVCRTDCQYTSEEGVVVMHHWFPKPMYGAGEPHRGWVNSYTRRVTAMNRDGGWEGETTQIVKYDVGGIGCMIRYPVGAMISDGKRHQQVSTEYTFNTKKSIVSKCSFPGNNTAIDSSRFVGIKVVSQHQYSVGQVDWEDLYLRLILTQTDRCLIAPHCNGNFNQHDYRPRMVNIHDPVFDVARGKAEPLMRQTIGIWKSMVNMTRKFGRNISFVGNEDGTFQVLPMKKGPYEHGNLSKMALGMFSDAVPSELDGKMQGYTEYDRTRNVGDWGIINADNGSVSTWGEE